MLVTLTRNTPNDLPYSHALRYGKLYSISQVKLTYLRDTFEVALWDNIGGFDITMTNWTKGTLGIQFNVSNGKCSIYRMLPENNNKVEILKTW